MTATLAPAADLEGVVRRADDRWARRHGDEPAAPEYLRQIVDAVRPLLGQPVAAPADGDQVQQLRDDKQRLGDLVAELRKDVEARDRTIDSQKATVEQAKAELASARRAAAAKLAAADADVERLTAQVTELDTQVQARGAIIERRDADIAQLHANVDELRRKLDAAEQATPPHQHRYLVDAPGTEPQACECGHPYPRAVVPTEPVKPSPPEPWAKLFGQIRAEAKTAGWKA
ncbi:hypothetical protein [Amycolatopsis eburnea]|uniref:Uncharacterized protein n=1 Tax=Amycolatopsis eburnea TaxID=2267691 RepID=A0A3R9EUC4_9PSEU|nr:hypothetical protein [Amycolatopsis eburnea]RSD21974.1 hypothetical protein EIY87_09155 [Amycolatopsis eburnea]